MTEHSNEVTPAVVSAGELLTQARERLGLTQQQVAERLNLRLSQVKEIERDHYDAHLSPTFIRGYLRAYARVVGVNENDVQSIYQQSAHATAQTNQDLASFSQREIVRSNESRITWISWIVGLTIAASIGWWWWDQQQQKHTADAVLSNSADITQSINEIAASIEEQETHQLDAQLAAEVTADTLGDDSQTASAAMATASAALVTGSGALATEVASEAAEVVATPAPSVAELANVIELSFNGDCWIKVTDAHGNVLSTGVKSQGEQLRLQGTPPYKLVLGAPTMVQLNYEGQPISLTEFPVGKTARFELPKTGIAE